MRRGARCTAVMDYMQRVHVGKAAWLMLLSGTLMTAGAFAGGSDRDRGSQDEGDRYSEVPIRGDGLPSITGIIEIPSSGQSRGVATGDCEAVTVTHSSATFEQGDVQELVLQAGFAEGEVAAAEVQVDPSEFPIRIDQTEMQFGQQNAPQTTTQWTWLVYEGEPSPGNVVYKE